MKYFAVAVAALVVFTGIILSTCERRTTDVYAVINGIEIKGGDFITDENRDDEEKKRKDLEEYIVKSVIKFEAQRLQTTEENLLGFFDSLKNREIKPNEVEKIFASEFADQDVAAKSKAAMLDAIRDKQFETAKLKYINELLSRSTILLVDDDGNFSSHHPQLISLPN